jgi:hypothetical protein
VSADTLTPELARAVADLEEEFPGRVVLEAQDESGLCIRIRDIPLSERWAPQSGDLWFAVPFHYPDAPIYPHHVTGATPSGGLVSALQRVTWRGMEATQVSLRHTAWDPNNDTAVGSALQTMSWLRVT